MFQFHVTLYTLINYIVVALREQEAIEDEHQFKSANTIWLITVCVKNKYLQTMKTTKRHLSFINQPIYRNTSFNSILLVVKVNFDQ